MSSSPEMPARPPLQYLRLGPTRPDALVAVFHGLGGSLQELRPTAERWLEALPTTGFLMLQAHPASTSATLRGIFIRHTLLCQTIPPPPADVDTSIPEADAQSPTLRQRLETHLELSLIHI